MSVDTKSELLKPPFSFPLCTHTRTFTKQKRGDGTLLPSMCTSIPVVHNSIVGYSCKTEDI